MLPPLLEFNYFTNAWIMFSTYSCTYSTYQSLEKYTYTRTNMWDYLELEDSLRVLIYVHTHTLHKFPINIWTLQKWEEAIVPDWK